MHIVPLTAVLATLLLAHSACTTTPAPVAAATGAPTAAPSIDASAPGAEPASREPEKDAGNLFSICGCSLCKPVVSQDPCSTDADCAPATPCHASECVARGKAVPRKPDTMCTMILRCDSIDANTCGCLEGRCSLYPRRK